MKILHLSDTHFHCIASNEQVMKRIEALKAFPNHIILITGDITDDGKDEQRANALTALQSLKNPIVLLPGNHDNETIGFSQFYDVNRAKSFDDFSGWFNCGPFLYKVPSVIQTQNVLFILLNSTIKERDMDGFATGNIGVKQLGLLDKVLSDPANKEYVKIVGLHHDPFNHDPTMRLNDSERFLKTIFGKVDCLCYGHSHEMRIRHGSGCKIMLEAPALFETNSIWEITVEGGNVSAERKEIL